MDYANEYPVAMKAITEWIEKGSLKRKFHVVDGLDAAPGALPLLYSGGNTGKLCVTCFALVELVSYFTLPGSSRFLSTKPQLGSKLRDCLYPVIFLISVVPLQRSVFIMMFVRQLCLSLASLAPGPQILSERMENREPLGASSVTRSGSRKAFVKTAQFNRQKVRMGISRLGDIVRNFVPWIMN